jgi:hypothetical protein
MGLSSEQQKQMRERAIQILNTTPLGYLSERDHEVLEKCVDRLEREFAIRNIEKKKNWSWWDNVVLRWKLFWMELSIKKWAKSVKGTK